VRLLVSDEFVRINKMNLNDLIEAVGEQVLEATKLQLGRGLTSFAGIERFTHLEEMDLRSTGLEVPHIENGRLVSYEQGRCSGIVRPVDFDISEMHYNAWRGDEDILSDILCGEGYPSFVQGLQTKEVPLLDFSLLSKSPLAETVRKVDIGPCIISPTFVGDFDLSFLTHYQCLKTLTISLSEPDVSKKIRDFSCLAAESLADNLETLMIDTTDYLTDISFLGKYRKLQTLAVFGCRNLADFSPLKSPSLFRTVKKLKLGGALGWYDEEKSTSNFSDLSLIQHYTKLRELDIEDTSVKNLSDLLKSDFVENGSLREIKIGGSIDWLRTENGRYINAEVVEELKRRGVKVEQPDTFHYKPSEIQERSRLYVIVSPPGSGKSTLMQMLEQEYRVKPLRKVTTRPYRPGESPSSKDITSISEQEFQERAKKGELLMHRQVFQNSYGLDLFEFIAAYHSKNLYMVDTSDPEVALRLQRAYPEFVTVIVVEPTPKLVEHGLRSRYQAFAGRLDRPDKGFSSIDDEIKYRSAVEQNMQDTNRRIRDLPEHVARLRPYQPFVDHYLQVSDYQELQAQVRQIVKGNVPQTHL